MHSENTHTDMVSLTMDLVCIYMCVCLSTLTLIASLMALYILIAKYEETGMRRQKEEDHQEVRQAPELGHPLCLPRL